MAKKVKKAAAPSNGAAASSSSKPSKEEREAASKVTTRARENDWAFVSNTMNEHPFVSEVQLAGCEAICNLLAGRECGARDNPDNWRRKLGDAGMCERVCFALQCHRLDASVTLAGCGAVALLAEDNSDANIKKLFSADAPTFVTEALNKFPDNLLVAQRGCHAIAALLGRDVGRAATGPFSKVDAWTAVVKALSLNATTPLVVLPALQAMRALGTFSLSFISNFGQMFGGEHVITAMRSKASLQDSTVQSAGCAVLVLVLSKGQAEAAAAAGAGGATANGHSQANGVANADDPQLALVKAHARTTKTDLMSRLLMAGAAKAVVAAVRVVLETITAQREANDPGYERDRDLIISPLVAFACLTKMKGTNLDDLGERGCDAIISALRKTMTVFPSDELIRALACYILAELSEHDNNRQKLFDAGVCDTIVSLFSLARTQVNAKPVNPTDVVDERGLDSLCRAVAALAYDTAICTTFKVKGVFESVVDAMQSLPDNTDVQAEGCWAIAMLILADFAANRSRLKQAQAGVAVQAAVRRHPSDSRVRLGGKLVMNHLQINCRDSE